MYKMLICFWNYFEDWNTEVALAKKIGEQYLKEKRCCLSAEFFINRKKKLLKNIITAIFTGLYWISIWYKITSHGKTLLIVNYICY